MTPAGSAGLPEGVDVVDFQIAGPDDFELVREAGEFCIFKGSRPGAASGVRVKPLDGYEFIQSGTEEIFDVKELKAVPGRPKFSVCKTIHPTTITATVTFKASNAMQLKAVRAALDDLKKSEGCLSVEASEVEF